MWKLILGGSVAMSLLLAQTPIPAGGDWPMYSHDLSGTRYSPLTQINAKNAATLKSAWTYRLRSPADQNTKGGGGVAGYLSATQINLVTPAGGYGSVAVNNNGAQSNSFNAYPPGSFAPAFFTWPNNQVVATRQDYTYAVAPGTFTGLTTVATKPGDVLILWGTGFGPTTPAVQDGAEVPSDQEYATSTTPTVTVNGVSATVYGAALAAGYTGLYQVAIQVPSTVGTGTWPIVATMGAVLGVSSPSNVMLVVKP